MMERNFKLQKSKSDTLAIYCADHRFQEAFSEFITDKLGIGVFNPLVIAGGAFALSSENFDRYGYIWDQVDYFVTTGGVKRVILINHEDCKWYKKENPDLSSSNLKETGKTDLSVAAKNIAAKYPEVDITSVWAELSGELVSFHKIE